MTTTKLTATERDAKISALCEIPPYKLEKYSLKELQELIRGTKICKLRSKKSEIIEKILDAQNQLGYRPLPVAVTNEVEAQEDDSLYSYFQPVPVEVNKSVLDTVKAITRSGLEQLDATCNTKEDANNYLTELATQVSITLSNSGVSNKTKSSYASLVNTEARRVMKERQNDSNYGLLNQLGDKFIRKINRLFETLHTEKRIENTTKLDNDINTNDPTEKKKLKILNTDKLINWSGNLLEEIWDFRDTPVSSKYWDPILVVAALLLATGRRTKEVVMTGQFEELGLDDTRDEYELFFSGQAKTKRELDAILIPTLVPAKYVLEGFKYLEDTGSRLDESGDESDDTKAVNSKFANPLSRWLAGKRGKIEDQRINWKELTNIKNAHVLRAIYVKLAYQNHRDGIYKNLRNVSKTHLPAFGAKVLIHNPGDLNTVNNYTKYEIVQTPVTIYEPYEEGTE